LLTAADSTNKHLVVEFSFCAIMPKTFRT